MSNTTTEFNIDEQKRIQEEVQKYNEQVRQAAIECEIRNQIFEMDRQTPGKRFS